MIVYTFGIQEMTKKIFIAMQGVAYGRADFRISNNGEVYFLEMNPNCGLFYTSPEDNSYSVQDADFILKNEVSFSCFTSNNEQFKRFCFFL